MTIATHLRHLTTTESIYPPNITQSIRREALWQEIYVKHDKHLPATCWVPNDDLQCIYFELFIQNLALWCSRRISTHKTPTHQNIGTQKCQHSSIPTLPYHHHQDSHVQPHPRTDHPITKYTHKQINSWQFLNTSYQLSYINAEP